MRRLVLAAAMLLGAVACAAEVGDEGEAGGGNCPVASEGCPCTGGGACDPGLDCRSDTCVDLSAGGGAGGFGGAGGGGGTGGGGPTVGDPVSYFGVAPCTCFEYVSEDPTNPVRLGIAVEAKTDVYTEGHEQYLVRYRLNGQQRRVDFVDPVDPELRLNWVNVGSGDDDHYEELADGLPFVTGPVDAQQIVEASTQALTVDLGTETGTSTLSMRATYSSEPVDVSLDGGPRQTLAATRIAYGGLPWGERVRWFVPSVGFVKLDLKLDENTGRITWILNRVRTLAGGCPWMPGDPIPGAQVCGI